MSRCDECEHPVDVDTLRQCECCDLLVCEDHYHDHVRECHTEECMCETCVDRHVVAAESMRDAMEDR